MQYYYFYFYFFAYQHKTACRKTRLDTQNYGCNGNLLYDHGVVERNCIFSLESHGKALEKEESSCGLDAKRQQRAETANQL